MVQGGCKNEYPNVTSLRVCFLATCSVVPSRPSTSLVVGRLIFLGRFFVFVSNIYM